MGKPSAVSRADLDHRGLGTQGLVLIPLNRQKMLVEHFGGSLQDSLTVVFPLCEDPVMTPKPVPSTAAG